MGGIFLPNQCACQLTILATSINGRINIKSKTAKTRMHGFEEITPLRPMTISRGHDVTFNLMQEKRVTDGRPHRTIPLLLGVQMNNRWTDRPDDRTKTNGATAQKFRTAEEGKKKRGRAARESAHAAGVPARAKKITRPLSQSVSPPVIQPASFSAWQRSRTAAAAR